MESVNLTVASACAFAAAAQLYYKRDGVNVPLVRALPAETRVLAMLRSTSTIGSDTDRVVNARTIVDGTYKWMLLNGTIVEVTGRAQGFTRIRLDGTLDVWVDSDDLVVLPDGAAMPRRVTARSANRISIHNAGSRSRKRFSSSDASLRLRRGSAAAAVKN